MSRLTNDPLPVLISSLVISNPRKRSAITVVPNAFPATKVTAARTTPGDAGPVEFIQVRGIHPGRITCVVPRTSLTPLLQDTEPSQTPNFLLKVNNDDELVFTFTFIIRQDFSSGAAADTHINGLTYVYASNSREVENLVTREFHADPNLHKNANVELVGDFNTGGSSSVTFEWTWKWRPPKPLEDRGGGWRNACSVGCHGTPSPQYSH